MKTKKDFYVVTGGALTNADKERNNFKRSYRSVYLYCKMKYAQIELHMNIVTLYFNKG